MGEGECYLRDHGGGGPDAQHLLHHLACVHHLIEHLPGDGRIYIWPQPPLLLTHLLHNQSSTDVHKQLANCRSSTQSRPVVCTFGSGAKWESLNFSLKVQVRDQVQRNHHMKKHGIEWQASLQQESTQRSTFQCLQLISNLIS